ncbi:MAG: alpha/beta hydrolase, partial [Gammaproteobacteria bacterium]|nr:alpha/beta hydrolase [Gammaproteobacteria bacterium]
NERSRIYRVSSPDYLKCRYGPGERELLDLFPSARKGASIIVYIHGGYWQRGDRSMYSFLAGPFVSSGLNVAVLGYPLCPAATLSEIVESIRRSIAWLWQNARKMDMDADRMVLIGHSAGGHLATVALTTRWPAVAPGLPDSILGAVMAISGLYLLEPLRSTTIATPLNLDDNEVGLLSPALHEPLADIPVAVVLGGAETGEFFRQADILEDRWRRFGMNPVRHVEPDVDHFDVINRLASPESALFQLAVELAATKTGDGSDNR